METKKYGEAQWKPYDYLDSRWFKRFFGHELKGQRWELGFVAGDSWQLQVNSIEITHSPRDLFSADVSVASWTCTEFVKLGHWVVVFRAAL